MTKQWVIPDIHGHSGTLQALIEDQLKPSRGDTLYFLGDYIDRGPDAKGVIDYIIGLKHNGYKIRTLRGNHEDYLIRTYDNEPARKNFLGLTHRNKLKKEWFKFGGEATLRSFGVSDVHDIPDQYITWLRKLEYFIELEKYILVHAGLNFNLDNPFDDRQSMLWIKEFKVDPEKIGNRKLIHGHVPVSLEFINLLHTTNGFDFIDLDNGIYMPEKEGFGNLVALELHSMELKVQTNIDVP
jgi:serine/threonine protein phosphatase 1